MILPTNHWKKGVFWRGVKTVIFEKMIVNDISFTTMPAIDFNEITKKRTTKKKTIGKYDVTNRTV